MKIAVFILSTFFLCNIIAFNLYSQEKLEFYIPISLSNRNSIDEIEITDIGKFGFLRKERKGIPAHLHTGLDIMRPRNNYLNEPIFPIAEGIVISLRQDGPFAQVIIEHIINDSIRIWSVYEHLSGICIDIYEIVDPMNPIGRFMNKEELSNYGWHFDHLHLEILKIEPKFCNPTQENPKLFFKTYWGDCINGKDLDKYYYHPLEFLYKKMN